jgi:hypothetical protein
MIKHAQCFAFSLIVLLISSCQGPPRESVNHIDSAAIKRQQDSIVQARKQQVEDSLSAVVAQMFGKWEVGAFVDNFGDATNGKFVSTFVEGEFSNSATTSSYLFVQVIMDRESAGIFLREYQASSPPQKFSESVQIQMKNERGKTLLFNTSGEWNQSGGIKVVNNIAGYYHWNFRKFRDFLKNSNGKVKCVIFDKYSSVYRFTLNSVGLAEEIKKI